MRQERTVSGLCIAITTIETIYLFWIPAILSTVDFISIELFGQSATMMVKSSFRWFLIFQYFQWNFHRETYSFGWTLLVERRDKQFFPISVHSERGTSVGPCNLYRLKFWNFSGMNAPFIVFGCFLFECLSSEQYRTEHKCSRNISFRVQLKYILICWNQRM